MITFLIPPQQAADLIWCRFINTRGLPGCNIPNDLHMEHLNCILKTSIEGLGANKTICHLGKALGVFAPVLSNFDEQNYVANVSVHKPPSVEKDIKVLVQELSSVFKVVPNRLHSTYPHPHDPLHAKSHRAIKKWIIEHIASHHSTLINSV